jgi:hypothetical protein
MSEVPLYASTSCLFSVSDFGLSVQYMGQTCFNPNVNPRPGTNLQCPPGKTQILLQTRNAPVHRHLPATAFRGSRGWGLMGVGVGGSWMSG